MLKIRKTKTDKLNEKIEIKSISKKVALLALAILVIGIISMAITHYAMFIEISEIGSNACTPFMSTKAP